MAPAERVFIRQKMRWKVLNIKLVDTFTAPGDKNVLKRSETTHFQLIEWIDFKPDFGINIDLQRKNFVASHIDNLPERLLIEIISARVD